jgi:hypothetical protein
MVQASMTYVKYLMYLEWVTLSSSATRVITNRLQSRSHGRDRAPQCRGPVTHEWSQERRFCGSLVKRKQVPNAYEYACRQRTQFGTTDRTPCGR